MTARTATTPRTSSPTESAAEARSHREFTIDELAQEAGATVRNVRAYQERGLLPPPQRRGRVGVYTEAHLARLRVISRMLERGYSLANVAELLAAWEQGHDIGKLLGLEAAITSPWSDETPVLLTAEQLFALLGNDPKSMGGLPTTALDKCFGLGLIQIEGDQFKVPSMKLLNVGVALAKEGVPLEELLDIVAGLRQNVERVANELVQLIVKHVFDKYGKDSLPPPDEAPHLAELVWQLRPMSMQAVDAEVARAMEMAANRFLGDRLSKVMEQMRRDERPPDSEKPA